MEETILRRTWAEIDLDALEHNYHLVRKMTGPSVKYLGVVKADAYGHGAVQISRKLEELGADYLAVSSLDEARELRHCGIRVPILILGHTPPDMVPQLIQYNITQTVSAKAKAEEYHAAAAACGGTLKVHIKVAVSKPLQSPAHCPIWRQKESLLTFRSLMKMMKQVSSIPGNSSSCFAGF